MTSDHTKAVLIAQNDRFNTWKGTAEQLVAAGLVETHMLPGQPGRNKTMVTINGKKGRQSYGPDYLRICKASRYRFIVTKGRDPQEIKRERRQQEATKAATARRDYLALMEKADSKNPTSAGAHKMQAIQAVETVEQTLWNCFAGRPRSLFSYDQTTLSRISAISNELRELAVNAPVVADHERKEREVKERLDQWMATNGYPSPPTLSIVK